MPPRASSVLVALALTACCVASGCGPSLRRVHRGNVYFERCYAADLDQAVPAEERRLCWQAWHAHYQDGASPERIDHATERLAMLDPAQAEAIALATGVDPVIPETEPNEASLVEIVSAAPEPEPVPTDVALPTTDGVDPVLETSATPTIEASVSLGSETPEVLEPTPVANAATHEQIVEAEERARAVERRSHRSILVPRSLTPHCARTCHPIWESCIAECTADEPGCVGACRRELRICAGGCY